MTMQASLQCLNEEQLRKLAHGDCSSSELTICEEHVSHCELCRDLLESRTLDATWREHFLPAFKSEPEANGATSSLDMAHQNTLNLLGPTDDPRMLGRIGSYEVLAIIGMGGMGVVFKAFDGALNRFVAIKMMLPHLASSGAARQRFEREGRAAAAVINDFVLPIYAVSEWQGVPYLVMQYSAGMNLQKRIQIEGPLKLSEVLRIGMQTARGLAAAHAQGLVHRDVKPSNVLLDGSVERAMLTDFGLARAADDASVTRTGLLAGTPQYMSPEQVHGDRVDTRSDLFSLGATIYAMCTGHSPFRGESSYTVLHRIINDTPRCIREVNADLPDWLDQIVMKLLSKSPDDRFESAEQVANLLEGCLAHVQQPTATPLPELLRTSASHHNRGPRRPRIAKLLTAAAFFVLVFAGVLIKLEWDKGTLTIECDLDNVPIRIMQGDKVVETLTVSSQGKSTRIAAGKYTIEVEHGFEKATIQNGVVTISQGDRQVVKVTSENKPVAAESKDATPAISQAPDRFADEDDVLILKHPDTGLIQIRGPSQERVARVAAMLKNLEELTAQIPNPFQKLFDAIATASNQTDPAPVPTELFMDCFADPSKPQFYSTTFTLKSIRNATRTAQLGGIVVYEFDVEPLSFIEEVAYLASGNETVAGEILDGMLRDPHGPQVDVKKELENNIGKRVKLTCRFHLDGTMEYMVEIGIRDQAAFMPTFQRIFESEPGYLANGSKDFYVARTSSTPNAKPRRLAAAVINNYLVWGSLEMVEAR